jgi:hypothetical protein
MVDRLPATGFRLAVSTSQTCEPCHLFLLSPNKTGRSFESSTAEASIRALRHDSMRSYGITGPLTQPAHEVPLPPERRMI